MDELLTTRQAAELLGVSESSIKRWCDRGVIPTIRTVGGHRRIPRGQFEEYVGQAKRLPLPADGLLGRNTSNEYPPSSLSVAQLRQDFEHALLIGDEGLCRKILGHCHATKMNFAVLADQIVASAFHGIGELWDCGDLEVYQERRGCEICMRLIGEFRRALSEPAPNAPVAIGGTLQGDNYMLASQLIELVLRESGWQACNLGTNLPFSTLLAAVNEQRPKLLWLSISHLDDEAAFIDSYRGFYAKLPKGLVIAVGGRALTDGVRPDLKYTAHCDNLQQLAAFAAALHGRPHKLAALGD